MGILWDVLTVNPAESCMGPAFRAYMVRPHELGVRNPHSKLQSKILGNRVLIEE